MQRMQHRSKSLGFTLVEVAVVAPMVLLMIGVFVFTVIQFTGKAMEARSTNMTVYDMQNALDDIEYNVKTSTAFLAENNFTPVSPQGSNNATLRFASTGGALILNTPATSTNKTPFYLAGAPTFCGNIQGDNPKMMLNTVYFISGSDLIKRTLAPANYNVNACGLTSSSLWQLPSCNTIDAWPACPIKDTTLMSGVTQFTVTYYDSPGSSTPVANATHTTPATRQAALDTATTAKIDLASSKIIAGKTITQEDSAKITRLNPLDNQSVGALPTTAPATASIPTVIPPNGGMADPGQTAIFEAEVVGNYNSLAWMTAASSGSCPTSPTNYSPILGTNSQTLSVPTSSTNYQQNRCFILRAQSGSTYAYSLPTKLTFTTGSTTRWQTISLGSGWGQHGDVSTWGAPACTITSAGAIVLQGMVARTSGSGTLIGTLPAGCPRPSQRLIFEVAGYSYAYARIDIETNGQILLVDGSATWISLNGVTYADPALQSYTLTPKTTWNHYGGSYGTVQYTIDRLNRVHLQGLLLNSNTSQNTADNTAVASGLPVPAKYQHIPASGSSGTNKHSLFGIEPNPPEYVSVNVNLAEIEMKGLSTTFQAIQTLYYPGSSGLWGALALRNNWSNYDAAASRYPIAQYTKANDGLVSLRGLVKGTTTGTITIGTLPAGYRPQYSTILPAGSNGGNFGSVQVDTGGNITVRATTNAWFTLDGVRFLAAP